MIIIAKATVTQYLIKCIIPVPYQSETAPVDMLWHVLALGACVDDAAFENNSGKRCTDYVIHGWCTGSGFAAGKEWTGGEQFNFPEMHCCACRRAPAATSAVPTTPAAATGSLAVPPAAGVALATFAPTAGPAALSANANVPTPVAAIAGFAAPLAAAVAPAASVPGVKPAASSIDASLPSDLAAALQTRLANCAASSAPLDMSQTLLYFARLPRTGSAAMCQVMGACSARQSRNAASCGAVGASNGANGACPSNGAGYSFYGSDKLPPANYAMCSGIDGLTPACTSFGGDQPAACTHLGTLKLPAAIMVSGVRLPDWTVAPCPAIVPAVRMMALLRDPGERAQSAFNFQLENCVRRRRRHRVSTAARHPPRASAPSPLTRPPGCAGACTELAVTELAVALFWQVCNFRFEWCKMFTSFRFRNRQTKLCEEHTPRHGFAAALGFLKAHGNLPWPLTSSETPHVLGRFTAGVVREVYTPWFGSYTPAGSETPRSSALLARRMLENCFSWVGIAEDLPLSLQVRAVRGHGDRAGPRLARSCEIVRRPAAHTVRSHMHRVVRHACALQMPSDLRSLCATSPHLGISPVAHAEM